MSSCVFNFNAKNEFTGEISGDILWQELRDYFKSHSMAKTYYGIATSQDFLDLASDRLSFNAQGLPTLESLMEVIGENADTERLRAIIEKSLGNGEPMDYSTAIYKIQAYNKENPSSQFFASFVENPDKTVTIKVLDNNAKNRAQLLDAVKKRSLVDRMMYYLRNAGVDVKFLEDGTQSVYSTVNAEQNAEGLYELIQLSQASKKNIRQDLTEHCGHLAIDILGDSNPLVQRLLDALERNDLYQEIIKQNPNFAAHRFQDNDLKAVAGWLVGNQFNQSIDKAGNPNNPINKVLKTLGNLLNRIIDAVKVKLKKIPSREYAASLRQVNDIAAQIAQGFTSPEFNGMAEDAIANAESTYLKDTINTPNVSTNVRVTKQVLDDLHRYVKSVRFYNDKLYKQLQKDLAQVESNIDFNKIGTVDDTIMNSEAMVALANALQMLIDNHANIIGKISKIDFNAEADFTANMGQYANDIRTALMYANTAENIAKLIDLYTIQNEKTAPDSVLQGFSDIEIASKYGGSLQKVDLTRINKVLKGLIEDKGGLLNLTKNLQRSYVKRFLTEIIGRNQIERADRVLGFSGQAVDGSTMSIDKIMDELGNDLNWWEKQFSSMSNNPDIWGQAFDKILKITKLNSNRKFLNDRNNLLLLQQEARKRGVNLGHLYDRDAEGVPTGYLIGYVMVEGEKFGADWGRWQEDFDEFTKQQKELFKEKYGARELSRMRESQRAVLWHKFYNKAYKDWHKENSITTVEKDAKGRVIRYINVPNPAKDKYGSDKYEKLTDDQKFILDRYIEWKEAQDSQLPNGATLLFRAPQIYASTINQVHNRMLSGQNIPKAVGATLMQDMCDLVTKNANDTDFGSDNTINTPDVLNDRLAYEDDKVERVPLFYINRLPKEKRIKLSTDLIGASMAYSAMANQYGYLSKIKDALEISHEQMKERRGKIHGKWQIDQGQSKAYKRVTTFMEKELYGLQFGHRMSGTAAVIAKLIQLSTALASRMFLGGNVQGGIANTAMGFTEVLKEAAVGEYFNMKDWRGALREYFGTDKTNGEYNFITDNLLLDSLRQVKRNKVNQFSDYFDAFGDNNRNFRYNSYFLEHSFKLGNKEFTVDSENLKAADLFWHNAFAPYSMGDHFMQLIPFIALAKHIKLHYIENGKVITKSMYDCYHIMHEGESEQHINKAGMFGIDSNHHYVKERKNVQLVEDLYQKLSDIDTLISNIEAHIQSLNGLGFSSFDAGSYQSILDEFGIEINNDATSQNNEQAITKLRNEQSKIQQQVHDLTWQSEDENAFKLKAREIGNRLHGIYNQQDKVEMQQNVLGNSVLAMRGYMLGMMERRWGGDKYSLALDKDVEGSERTWIKTICALFGNNEVTVKKFMAMNFLPIFRPQYVQDVMQECGFSENQYYNMRRHQMDWFVILGTTALVGGLLRVFGYTGLLGRPSGSDPDDYYPKNEDDYAAALAYYFLSRLYMEQAAYNEITSFTQVEGPSVLSLFGSNLAMLSNAYNIFTLMMSGEDYQQGEWKGEKKWKIKALKYTPYFRWHYSVGHDPRKAAEAFELNRGSYGRK